MRCSADCVLYNLKACIPNEFVTIKIIVLLPLGFSFNCAYSRNSLWAGSLPFYILDKVYYTNKVA